MRPEVGIHRGSMSRIFSFFWPPARILASSPAVASSVTGKSAPSLASSCACLSISSRSAVKRTLTRSALRKASSITAEARSDAGSFV